jgi:hypothetical protein
LKEQHYQRIAKAAEDLLVRGDYLEIELRRIALHSRVRPWKGSKEVRHVSLFEAIVSNIWAHRISTDSNVPLLIDSDGFQHAEISPGPEAEVITSNVLSEGMLVPRIADTIEAHARTRGWIAFPELSEGSCLTG